MKDEFLSPPAPRSSTPQNGGISEAERGTRSGEFASSAGNGAGGKGAGAVGVILLLAVILFLTLPHSSGRKYPKRIPVRFWHLLSGEWEPMVNKLVDRFNHSQDKYEVIPLLLPGDDSANTKFMLSVAGGEPPDVMLHWTQGMSAWADAGILQPLDTLMTPEEKHRFLTESYPVIRRSGWYKGHLYGITEGFDLFVCYYRPDKFRAVGLDPDHFPTTLEGLTEAGKKLDQFDAAGNVTHVGFLPQGFINFTPTFGGDFYDPKTDQVLLDTPQNRAALSYIVATRKRLGFDKVLRYNAGLTDGDANWPFITGAYSIVLDGEWRVQQLSRYAPQLDYRVALLPPPKGGKAEASYSSVNYLTIPKGARETKGAWEFIKFMTGLEQPERAAEFYPWFSWLPMSPRQAHAPAYEAFLKKFPHYRTFLKLAESDNIVTTPPVPYQLYLMDRIQQADDLATHGTLTPQRALSDLAADIAREEARRKELNYGR